MDDLFLGHFLTPKKVGGLWEPVGGRREVVSHHGATRGGGPGAENAAFSTVYFGGFFPGGLAAYGRGAMSAKNVSKSAQIVHKLVKNVHFFTQKRHFSTFFARGRGDFLAAPKMAKMTKFGVARVRGTPTEISRISQRLRRPEFRRNSRQLI